MVGREPGDVPLRRECYFVTECQKQIEWIGNCSRFWHEYLFNGWNSHCTVRFSSYEWNSIRWDTCWKDVYINHMEKFWYYIILIN